MRLVTISISVNSLDISDNKEAVADEWKEKLLAAFLFKRYWYLARIVLIYAKWIHPVVLKATRRSRDRKVECEPDPR